MNPTPPGQIPIRTARHRRNRATEASRTARGCTLGAVLAAGVGVLLCIAAMCWMVDTEQAVSLAFGVLLLTVSAGGMIAAAYQVGYAAGWTDRPRPYPSRRGRVPP